MIVKVKDLIEELHKQDPEAIVLIAEDNEGTTLCYLLGLFSEPCLVNEGKQEDLDEVDPRNYIEKAVVLYPKCT
jgi:hypothetical protein